VAYDSLAYCGSDTLAIALFPPASYSKGLDRFLEDIRSDAFWNGVVHRLQTYVPLWPSWEGNGWTDNFVECCGIQHIYVLGSRDPSSSAGASCPSASSGRSTPGRPCAGSCWPSGRTSRSSSTASAGALREPRAAELRRHDRAPLCINSVDEIYDRSGRSWLEAWGSFPHVVRRYVKERKTLELQAVVERFTSRVAERLGIADRGYLRAGCFADIVVLDLSNYSDHRRSSPRSRSRPRRRAAADQRGTGHRKRESESRSTRPTDPKRVVDRRGARMSKRFSLVLLRTAGLLMLAIFGWPMCAAADQTIRGIVALPSKGQLYHGSFPAARPAKRTTSRRPR